MSGLFLGLLDCVRRQCRIGPITHLSAKRLLGKIFCQRIIIFILRHYTRFELFLLIYRKLQHSMSFSLSFAKIYLQLGSTQIIN